MKKILSMTAASVVLFAGASLAALGCGDAGMKETKATDNDGKANMSSIAGNESSVGGSSVAGNESSVGSATILDGKAVVITDTGTDQ